MSAQLSSLFGMQVIVNPMLDYMPRMQTSTRFRELMPAEFVAELDAWMLQFFGRHSIAIKLGDNTVAVGPKAYAALLTDVRTRDLI